MLTACATQPVAAPPAAGEAQPAQDGNTETAAEAGTTEEGVSVDTVAETSEEEAASGQYQEAPMLADMVSAGDLPPVDERLPANPMVLTPVEMVGTYGGELKWVHPTPDLGAYEFQFLYEAPYRWSADASKIEPNLAVSHEYASDGLSMTLTFREGIKWSDGEPFTSADVDFWWNDLVMNADNSFTPPYWTITAEQPMQLEVVDDYTIKVIFNEPNWLFHALMASTSDYMRMYAPRHYLEQFHPDYNSAVTDFSELEVKFPPDGNLYTDPALPVLSGWHTVDYVPGQTLTAERNPFYWKVDTEGNQLPYIDRIILSQVEDPRVIPLKIVSGEVDFMARDIPLDSFSTLKASEEDGNYRVIQWKVGAGADPAIIVNWDNPDPVMRELIHNQSFRKGLSHAIDRETINDVVYFGLGTPSQSVTSPYSPWGRTTPEGQDLMQQWRNLNIEYDLDLANQLLDEAGLDQRDDEDFRLRPDGERLSLVIITGNSPDSRAVDVLEFVAEGWKAVGVDTTINSMDWNSGFWPKFSNGEYDVAGWDAWTGYYIPTIPDTLFPVGSAYWGTPLTARWFNTLGEEGIEPEPGGPMAQMMDIYKKMLAATTEQERNQQVLEAVKIHVEQGPFFLGAVNDIPNLVVARPNLRNIADFAFTGSWAQGAPGSTNPTQYFFEE
jgi:peptide/nickel transport system substrate-binding protein